MTNQEAVNEPTHIPPFKDALRAFQEARHLSDETCAAELRTTVSGLQEWKNGGMPRSNSEKGIELLIGYDFVAYRYQHARTRMIEKFPDLRDDPWVQEATTMSLFRARLLEIQKEISIDLMLIATGRSRSQQSMVRIMLESGSRTGREDIMADLIRALPLFRQAITGDIFKIYTPIRHVLARAQEIRRELGMKDREDFVSEHLHMTTAGYQRLIDHPNGAIHLKTRTHLAQFITWGEEEIVKRRKSPVQQSEKKLSWSVLKPLLQRLVDQHDASKIGRILGTDRKRVQRWLNDVSHPNRFGELDRIEQTLREHGLLKADGTPTNEPPSPPVEQPVLQPQLSPKDSTSADTLREVRQMRDAMNATLERLQPLLALLGPSTDEYVAGGTPNPNRRALRFCLTAETFRPLLAGTALSPEEIEDTIHIIVELLRRIKVIVEAHDLHAKKRIDEYIHMLYESMVVLDAENATEYFRSLRANKEMFGTGRGGGGFTENDNQPRTEKP